MELSVWRVESMYVSASELCDRGMCAGMSVVCLHVEVLCFCFCLQPLNRIVCVHVLCIHLFTLSLQ
jgi:hypothetical protein